MARKKYQLLRLSTFKLFGVLLFFCVLGCKEYDDTELWNEINNLANKIASLERICNETNTNVGALQKTVKALEENDYITNVSPINESETIIGYTITFAKNGTITIYNGRDGKDGKAPAIGVKKDSDGVYYWTVGNEWLTDGKNNKIKAEAQDGKDGKNGTSPTFKIQDGLWYVSYDGGSKWEKLGKATGEDGKDATSISIKEDDKYVYLTFPSGTSLTFPKSADATIEELKVTTLDANVYDMYVIVTGKVENANSEIMVGVIYGETESLSETKDEKVSKTTTSNIFSVIIKNLGKGKTYYYKTYAVINGKYYFGETKSFVYGNTSSELALGMKKVDVVNALPQSGVVSDGDILYYHDSQKNRTLSYRFKNDVLTEMALTTYFEDISETEIEEMVDGAKLLGYLTPDTRAYVNKEKGEVIKIKQIIEDDKDYLSVGISKL